jgi:uncharacterized protein YjbI with pentapeptide repeats
MKRRFIISMKTILLLTMLGLSVALALTIYAVKPINTMHLKIQYWAGRRAFMEAELARVSLSRAKLSGASLTEADLSWAYLRGANLEGADFLDANLFRAILDRAIFNEDTRLPDGTKWTPDTDMARFTDINHPDFWWPGAEQ